MIKFGRNYQFTAQGNDGSIVSFGLPFTCEFDIVRNTFTSANTCKIRFYNLAKDNRDRLRFNISNFGGPYIPITFQAGYGNDMSVIFQGNVSQGWSERTGPNFITQLECYDGGFAFGNAYTNLQVRPSTPFSALINQFISSLGDYHVVPGAIGNYPGVLSRGSTYSGNTCDLLRELTGNGFYIDRGIGSALGSSEYFANSSPTLLIESESGLLGSPILENNIVRFDMIFEPGLVPGQAIFLNSTTQSFLNNLYKVTSVHHRGTISAAISGEVITTGEFFYLETPTPVSAV